MIRRFSGTYRLFLAVSDGFLFAASIFLAALIKYGDNWQYFWYLLSSPEKYVLVVMPFVWILILFVFGLYKPRRYWSYGSEVAISLKAVATVILIVLAGIVIFKVQGLSRLFLFAFFLILTVSTVLYRIFLRFIFGKVRKLGYDYRNMIIIGAGERGQRFLREIKMHPQLGLRIVGFLDDAPEKQERIFAGVEVIGKCSRLEDILHDQIIDEVVVALPFSQIEKISGVIKLCEQEGKNTRLLLDFSEVAVTKGQLGELNAIPFMNIVHVPNETLKLVGKRVFDLGFSLMVLLFLAPVFLALALTIKLSSRGPVFFKQERVGLHGRRFLVYKFRSMVSNAEEKLKELRHLNEMEGPVFKIKDDPRITAIGRFLRKTSLDELPQFINVLKGEMSVVGPRPPLPQEVQEYDNWHRRRLSVKPGITCLWQVSGRNDIPFEKWVELDLEYIDNWNFWLDLKIIFRTCITVLNMTGH